MQHGCRRRRLQDFPANSGTSTVNLSRTWNNSLSSSPFCFSSSSLISGRFQLEDVTILKLPVSSKPSAFALAPSLSEATLQEARKVTKCQNRLVNVAQKPISPVPVTTPHRTYHRTDGEASSSARVIVSRHACARHPARRTWPAGLGRIIGMSVAHGGFK